MATVTVPVIRSDEDLSEAIARIETLWGSAKGTENGDELETLMVLVNAYETERYDIPAPTPVQAVEGLMDRLNLSQKDLIPCFGSAARVSEFLTGKRSLSKNQMIALHRTYGIAYDVLIDDAE